MKLITHAIGRLDDFIFLRINFFLAFFDDSAIRIKSNGINIETAIVDFMFRILTVSMIQIVFQNRILNIV